MDPNTQKDFFISYTSTDRPWAEWIAWQLEHEGFSVVIQAWDFRPGGNFVLDMHKAATETQRIIAVLSPNYFTALYTQPEWAVAFAQDPEGKGSLLVPVRIHAFEPTGIFKAIVYIDLVGLDESTARERLLAGINWIYEQSCQDGVKPAQEKILGPEHPETLATREEYDHLLRKMT